MTVNVQLLKMEQYKYYKKMTIQNWTDREEYINLIWLVVNRRRGGGEKNSEWNEEGEVEMPRAEGQEGKIIYKTFNNRRRKKTLELKKKKKKKRLELSKVEENNYRGPVRVYWRNASWQVWAREG